MKILVTGAAGFIGSHLCDALVALGHRVVAVDNLLLGTREHIAHLRHQPRFAFYEQDLLELRAVQAIFEREAFEAVFHLAANSDIQRSAQNPEPDLMTWPSTMTRRRLAPMRHRPSR